MTNPKVFFDVSIGGKAAGRIQFELQYVDVEATVGRLVAQRAELRAALEREGLLDANARVPLAMVPLRLGLVASRDSEGLRDFLGDVRALPTAVQTSQRTGQRAAVDGRRTRGAGAAFPLAGAVFPRAFRDRGENLAVAAGAGAAADATEPAAAGVATLCVE